MDLKLRDVQLFLMTVDTLSLTQSARRLNISPMSVSRRLAALENELGARLLHRTTRSVALTDEGKEFLPYARSLLEAEEGARTLFRSDGAVSGHLRISAPTGFGRRTVLPLLPALLADNPALRVEIQLSDDLIDIVGLGYDIALRIAPLRDSRLVARKLSDNPRLLCASPDYLKKHGAPRRLADLARHSCLRLANVLQWSFVANGQPTSISVDGRFSASNVEGVRALCMAGAGLAQLTEWDVRDELRTGELVRLELEDVFEQMLAVWGVFPTNRHVPARVKAFLTALSDAMALAS